MKLSLKNCFTTLFFLIIAISSNANVSDTKALSSAIHTEKILIDHHYIVYNVVGEGKNILLLHGMFGSKEQWQQFMLLLAEKGYHVITPDLPGYGKSQGYPLAAYAPAAQVQLIRKLTQKLDLKETNIAGNSMGGLVAALYAKNYPDQILSLAFLGAPFGVKTPHKSPADVLLQQGINPFIPTTRQEFDQEMRILFTHPPQLEAKKIEKRIAQYKLDREKDSYIWSEVQNYHSVFNKNFSLKCPTLIIWGERDKAIDISGANILKNNIQGSQLITIANGSHLLFMENPKEIAEDYLHFLAQVKQEFRGNHAS